MWRIWGRHPYVYDKQTYTRTQCIWYVQRDLYTYVYDKMCKGSLCTYVETKEEISTYMYMTICAKRSLHMWKETPTCLQRDLCVWKETHFRIKKINLENKDTLQVARERRRRMWKRDPFVYDKRPLHIWKETTIMKKDTFQNWGGPPIDARATMVDVEKRPICKWQETPTYVKRDSYMYAKRSMCMKRDIVQNQGNISGNQGDFPSDARMVALQVPRERRRRMWKRNTYVYAKRPLHIWKETAIYMIRTPPSTCKETHVCVWGDRGMCKKTYMYEMRTPHT